MNLAVDLLAHSIITVLMPRKRFPTPITNRAVTVIGRVFTNCLLDERYVALGYRGIF